MKIKQIEITVNDETTQAELDFLVNEIAILALKFDITIIIEVKEVEVENTPPEWTHEQLYD